MIQNVERILKVIKLRNSETEERENMVYKITGEEQLRNFIRERETQKDIIEITREISKERAIISKRSNF